MLVRRGGEGRESLGEEVHALLPVPQLGLSLVADVIVQLLDGVVDEHGPQEAEFGVVDLGQLRDRHLHHFLALVLPPLARVPHLDAPPPRHVVSVFVGLGGRIFVR